MIKKLLAALFALCIVISSVSCTGGISDGIVDTSAHTIDLAPAGSLTATDGGAVPDSAAPGIQNISQETVPTASQEEVAIALGAYRDVLQGTEMYDTESGGYTTFRQFLELGGGFSLGSKKCAAIDIDHDGIPEAVFWLEKTLNGYTTDDRFGCSILRYEDGVVYHFFLDYRSFSNLKEDGTFRAPNDAPTRGIYSIAFSKDSCFMDKFTYCEYSYAGDGARSIIYVVDHNTATKDVFDAANNIQDDKPDADWQSPSDDLIRTIFPEYDPVGIVISRYYGYIDGHVYDIRTKQAYDDDGMLGSVIDLRFYQYYGSGIGTSSLSQQILYQCKHSIYYDTIHDGFQLADVNGDGYDDIILDLGMQGRRYAAVCFVYVPSEDCFAMLEGYDELSNPEYVKEQGLLYESWYENWGSYREEGINKYSVDGTEMRLTASLSILNQSGTDCYTEKRLVDGEMVTVKENVRESEIDDLYGWYCYRMTYEEFYGIE